MKSIRYCLLLCCLLSGYGQGWAENQPRTFEAASEEGGARRPETENDPEFYLQLITGMQEKKLYFASLAHLDAFDRRWPGDGRAALLRGDALREVGYFERAKAIYLNMLKTDQSAGAYHGLGIIASRQGDGPAAVAAFDKANRIAPTNTAILNDLGFAQLLEGRLEDARLSLHKAAELDLKNARIGANLALLYQVENKTERATSIMNWYQMPEASRQEIRRKALEIAAGRQKKMLDSVQSSESGRKIDKVEDASQISQE